MEIHHQLETGLSIVIPVYNSQDSLELLVQELLKTLPDLCKPFEIILVDDGSRDGSWTVLSGLTKQS
nr:glycosyltransferase [Anaerolineae bacterium]